jgi:hypothetical protein
MPWRGADLDSVVLLCLAQYGPLKTNALIEAIDPKEWEAALHDQEVRDFKRATGRVLEYQGMLTRLHRLADDGKVQADRSGGAYHWRLLSPGERAERERQLQLLWRCPTNLARHIERSAAELEGTAEFFVSVGRTSRYDRYFGADKVTAGLVVKLPRGEVVSGLREPGAKAWRAAAEECGLLL